MNEDARWTSTATPSPEEAASKTPHVAWIDGIKALALLWVVLVHWSERIFGFPYFANPTNDWPPLADRFDQLRLLHGHGLWDWPLSALRLAGWMGDAGVQLFLIVSGFGLTYALLQRRRRLSWPEFVRRRLGRVYPTWWVAHFGLLAAGLVLPIAITPASDVFWLSVLGFRATPATLYALCPAWWFIGLIFQLYAVFPFLYGALSRLGARRFAVFVIGGSILIRGLGLWFFAGPFTDWHYLDAWSRGAIFVARLPEFAAGMLVASAYVKAPQRVDAWLRSKSALAWAVVVTGVGFGASFFLLGNAVSMLLLGSGPFVLFGIALARPLMATGVGSLILSWLSRHSLSLFMTHQLVLEALIPPLSPIGTSLWTRTAAALALSVVAAMALEAAVTLIGMLLRTARSHWGGRGAGVRLGLTALVVYALLLTAEVVSRRIAPQEIAGWGERASLTPDDRFGWTLVPSQTTWLRWQTYDYRVEANALGFPGPVYPESRPSGTLRILTTGDAFTSAEGVDTEKAWPRLLEADLARRRPDRPVQVMNFAITGYGPNQDAAVVEAFAPHYKPDVVVVELFVNDLDDATTTTQQFQRQIGFGHPRPDGLFATLSLGNLYAASRQWIRRILFETVLGRSDPQGGFLAMLPAFAATVDDEDRRTDAAEQAAVDSALQQIKQTTNALHSRLIVLIVPAGIQVCTAEQLPYFPLQADLSDPKYFDLERPQRLLSQVTASLAIETHDLRPVLRSVAGGCPYQPHNLHWLESGHAAVAAFVASLIATDPRATP